jgi:hypothetical protein
VSGHEFTHAVPRKEKNNSLLPQARRAAQRSDIKEAQRSGATRKKRSAIKHSPAKLSALRMPKLPKQITLNSSQHFTGERTTHAQHTD